MIWQVVARVIGILVFVYLVIPMSMDIPQAINGQYSEVQGRAELLQPNEGWDELVSQRFYVNGEIFNYYALNPKIRNQYNYTIRYLNHSHFVIKANQENN